MEQSNNKKFRLTSPEKFSTYHIYVWNKLGAESLLRHIQNKAPEPQESKKEPKEGQEGGVVVEEDQYSTTKSIHDIWTENEFKTKQVMLDHLSNDYQLTFRSYESAQSMWDAITTTFSRKSHIRSQDLREEFASLTVRETRNNLEDYIVRFQRILNDLREANDGKPEFSNDQVVANFTRGIKSIDKLGYFLRDLRRANPMPDIDLVIQDCRSEATYQQINLKRNHTPNNNGRFKSKDNDEAGPAAALNTHEKRNNSRGNKGHKGKGRCSIHPNADHNNDKCWSQHEELRPEGWVERKTTSTKTSAKGKAVDKGSFDREAASSVIALSTSTTKAIGLSPSCWLYDTGASSQKSGISSAYSKAGSMLDDCQSMKSVTTVGSSSETKMFLLWRSA